MSELKELQINIFYDCPSTNYVPLWKPVVAGRCLQCGRARAGVEETREKERTASPGSELSTLEPGASPLAAGERSAEGSGVWQDLLSQLPESVPAGRVAGPGNCSRRRGDNGGEAERGSQGDCRVSPRLERCQARVCGQFRKMRSSD